MDSDYLKLEVRASEIPGAGNGVFATDPIMKGELVGEYRGKLILEGDEISDRSKMIRISEFMVDGFGIDKIPCIIALINDCVQFIPVDTSFSKRLTDDDFKLKLWEGKGYNCAFEQKHDKMFAIATRDITPGEELYISYGIGYWFNALLDKFVNNMNESPIN